MEKKVINQANWEQWRTQNKIEQFKLRQQRLQKIENTATVLAVAIVIAGGAVIMVKLGGVMAKDLQRIGI